MKIENIIEKVESNESYHEERNHISSSVLKKIYSIHMKGYGRKPNKIVSLELILQNGEEL